MASDRLPVPRILVYLLFGHGYRGLHNLSQLGATLLVVAALALPSTGSAQSPQGQRLYKWTDSNGVIHYGDKIPPEYANLDRNVLNDQGVSVGFEEGEVTRRNERPSSSGAQRVAEAERRAKAESRPPRSHAARDLFDRGRHRGPARSAPRAARIADQGHGALSRQFAQATRRAAGRGQQHSSRTRRAPTRRRFPRIWRSTSRARRHRSRSTSRRWRGRARIRQRCGSSFDGDIARFRELKGG